MSRLITNLSSSNINLLSSDINQNLTLFNLDGNLAVNGPSGINVLNSTGPQGDTGPQGPEGGNAAFVLRWNYEGTGPLTQNGYFITNSTGINEINQFRFAYIAFGGTVSEYLFNQLEFWVENENNYALITFIDETQPTLFGTYLVNNLNYTGAFSPSPDSYIVDVTLQTSSGGFLNINDQCLFSIAFIGPTGPQGDTGPTLPIQGENTGSVLLTNSGNVYYNDVLQVLEGLTGVTGIGLGIVASASFVPSISELYNLGSTGLRWNELFVGPGSISLGPATLSSDNDGIAYSEFGFATPFINVGPEIAAPGAVGGWQISSTGSPTGTDFDLVAQQNTIDGLTGPIYSLINNPGPTGETGPQGYTGPQGPTGPNPYLNYTISPVMTGNDFPDLLTTPGEFDFYQIDTANNPVNITLPLISSLSNGKRIFIFSDVGGNLSTNNTILNATGTNVIGNSTSLTMNIDYSSLQLAANGGDRWIPF